MTSRDAAQLLASYERVIARLATQPWWRSGTWLAEANPFPDKSPDGVTLHLFKAGWQNQDRAGIHIESYRALSSPLRCYVTIHIFHPAGLARLGIDRKLVSKPIVDALLPKVSQWDGYEVRAGKYGMQPFTLWLTGSEAKIEGGLVRELARLCRAAGPVVDRVVEEADL